MASEDPYRRPEPPRGPLRLGDAPLTFSSPRSERNIGPEGLGGWLIVVAIVLGWSLLRTGTALKNLASVLSLGTPSVAAMFDLSDPMNAPLSFVFTAKCVLLLLNLLTLVLFFLKSRWFPRVFIAWWVGNAAVATIAMLMVRRMVETSLLEEGYLLESTLIDTACGLSFAAFWIAYTLMSKRVKNTFGRRSRRL